MSPTPAYRHAQFYAVLWVILVLTPGFLVGRGIEIVGLDSRYQDRILAALTAASCLLIVLGLAATLRRRRN